MNTLLIIGQKSGRDPELDPNVDQGYGYTRAVPCHNRDELYKAVVESSSASPIDTLDIFDHGTEGAIAIGDEILVDFRDVTKLPDVTLFQQIATHLAPRAHVRLLGCKTGLEFAGRRLLVALHLVLGGERLVFGTLERTRPHHFGPEGFKLSRELLYSSLAAIDREAPDAFSRQHTLVTFVKPIIAQLG